MDCTDVQLHEVLFTPNDALLTPIPLYQHVVYIDGAAQITGYSELATPELLIDVATFSGGGTVGSKDRVLTPGVQTFTGNAVQSLPVAAGARGNIVSVADVATGQARWTIDGSAPTITNGFTSAGVGIQSTLHNVRLDLFRITGSAGGSRYSVAYEVYS